MPDTDTLITDIYKLFDGHECDPKLVEEFGSRLAEMVSDRLLNWGEPQRKTLRMSNVGRPCARQLWYDINSEDEGEPLLPHTRIKFMLGDVVEELLLYLAKEAGHEVTHEQAEVEIGGIKGHCDAVIDGEVVDVKSASTYAFRKFDQGTLEDDDPFGYVAQISGYREALDVEHGGFLAMDKQNGHLAYYRPSSYVDMGEHVELAKVMVADPIPPDRGFEAIPDGKSGNMKLGVNCSYCPRKQTCWPGVRTFLYGGGRPVHLVEVKRTPKVPEIT